MIDVKDIQSAINHGNAITQQLANEGKFVFSGVVHSLVQVIRVLHTEVTDLRKKAEKAATPLPVEEKKIWADSAPKPEDID